jgi:X-X-X-Leu-X-X-Gly heptad repeat protein
MNKKISDFDTISSLFPSDRFLVSQNGSTKNVMTSALRTAMTSFLSPTVTQLMASVSTLNTLISQVSGNVTTLTTQVAQISSNVTTLSSKIP